MRMDDGWSDVCMLNISSRGLLLQCESPPERGSYVEIRRAAHVIVGRVVWRKDRRFGLYTQEKLNIGAIASDPCRSADTHRSLPGSPQITERRAGHRTAAQIARNAEHSRHLASAFQYAVLAGAGAVAATFLMIAVLRNFVDPMAIIADRL